MVRGWGCLVLVSLVFGYVFSGSGIDGNDDDIVLCNGYFITVMEWWLIERICSHGLL